MKRQLMITTFLILALVAQSAFITGLTRTTQAASVSRYIVVDLGTLGGSISYAAAINNRAQVTGASSLPGDPTDPVGDLISHTFLYQYCEQKSGG
jgi:hypothetical protein